MKVLITGGCGFIGSHVARAFVNDGWEVTNLDKLTYAANPRNTADLSERGNYRMVEGDLCDAALVRELVAGMDLVVNFAAETHVDRSLLDPAIFARTDVEGVVCLLEAIRADGRAALIQMSTDEVFGSLAAPDEATEERAFAPSSPYSASKAAAELMIRAYCETYDLPVTVIRSCNVFGPNQHIEKFIPLFTMRALAGERMPLYGDGMQEREWLFVDDLVAAFRLVARALPSGGLQALHVGSSFRIPNIEIAREICRLVERSEELIQPVLDRAGHDRRYALDSSKLRAMGWAPTTEFAEGLARTVAWHRENAESAGADGEFAGYFERQYGARLG
ncbi:MAG: dTDP-glucose 4,6-dehydratase [Dehalococcoidia bacterium]